MIKDFTLAFVVFISVKLSWIVELLGVDTHEGQKLAYDLGIMIALLSFSIWAITEVKGNRIYLWLLAVITSGMNIPNVIFKDLKLDLGIILISYFTAAIAVFLYRKYK